MRQRGQGGCPLRASISFSSSDSDGDDAAPRRRPTGKKKGCKASKKPCPCPDGGTTLWACFNVRKQMDSCLDRMKCGMSCVHAGNARCMTTFAIILTSLVLLYLFGPFVWSLVKRLLPPSLFKSTSTIVDEALARYNADKLGLADYALESAGGSVLCSSNTYYSRDGALYSIFGVPLWYHSSSPREVIQPEVNPGKCWAMDGSHGYVMVQLSMPVIVSAISLEHIPARVAPMGRIDSAPKDFAILGKEKDMESPDVNLGNFLFSPEAGTSIQTFAIKDPYCIRQTTNYNECGPNQQVFRIIELRVQSNHGNKDYTCIYRLRVHGKPLVQVLKDREYGGEKITVP